MVGACCCVEAVSPKAKDHQQEMKPHSRQRKHCRGKHACVFSRCRRPIVKGSKMHAATSNKTKAMQRCSAGLPEE